MATGRNATISMGVPVCGARDDLRIFSPPLHNCKRDESSCSALAILLTAKSGHETHKSRGLSSVKSFTHTFCEGEITIPMHGKIVFEVIPDLYAEFGACRPS
jgi:hypothetical protein